MIKLTVLGLKENRFFNYVCTFLCRDENAYHKFHIRITSYSHELIHIYCVKSFVTNFALKWIFSWHPKSEKWVLPRTSSYISIGRVPEGHESFGTVWTSPWQNHFSDFGCQEKAFSEITVLNSKMLKMQIFCCQKTREINAI